MRKSLNHRLTSHQHEFVKASNGEEVRYFKNANVAAKELGFSHVLAVKVLRGEFNSAKGWKLSYIDRLSEEGLNAKVDVRNKSEKRWEMRKTLMQKRKERVKELGLSPKMAHSITAVDPETCEEIVTFPNIYQA